MMKRFLTAACALALAAGCTGTRDTGSTGSTGTTGTHGSTGGGSTGSTGSTGTTSTSAGTTTGTSGSVDCSTALVHSIADARSAATPAFSAACLSGMVTVYASSYGDPKPDGGTQFDGKYYLSDGTDAVINAFKSKKLPSLSYDPQRGDKVDAVGKVELFPADGGNNAQVELTGSTVNFTSQGAGTLPTPMQATAAQLDSAGTDDSAVGHFVHVPAGTYTQDAATTVFQHHSGTSVYQDGIALSDGQGHTLLVDTYSFKFTANNCLPADGGFPDLSGGNFNAVFDHEQTDDGNINKVLIYASCGQ